MKYAWIEELVDGPEILVDGPEILIDGDEILDVGDVSFDPPQFEQVSQDPPVFTQVSQDPPVFEQVGTGNGSVTGLNRGAQEGEREGNTSMQTIVWGMDNDFYKVVAEEFTAKDQDDLDVIAGDRIKASNAQKAKTAQLQSIKELEDEDLRVKYSIPVKMNAEDIQVRKDHIIAVQNDIETPSEDPAYNPPLPPGVVGPTEPLTIQVDRVAGWQGNLGWKATIVVGNENLPPASLAMAWYTSADCTGYVATTGAFVLEGADYTATCPAGFEPGDVDVHLGLLFGAAKLSCFTVPAGTSTMTILAYEPVI